MRTHSTPSAEKLSDAPQPIRNGKGATDPGPRNVEIDRQNPDILTPPETDEGTIPNLKFSFSLAHNRLEQGGWAREVTARELPVATDLAAVNMRLDAGAVRELHWHKESEWSIMLSGRARITAIDEEGRNFIDDIGVNDLWFFPAGIPHSIQGLDEGCEFLLVFDDGNFSENETFLITDLFAHMPRNVLAKNFGVAESEFKNIPKRERYIFKTKVPGSLKSDRVTSPHGAVPQSFSYHMAKHEPLRFNGGSVRIIDSNNFPVTTTAAAIVDIEPGGMRELHWHPNADELQYFVHGEGRMTVFSATSKARTFNVRGGDVGYIPFCMAHYVENTGSTPLRFVETFREPRFQDVSVNQWMALIPPELVRDHLNLGDDFMNALRKKKEFVVR